MFRTISFCRPVQVYTARCTCGWQPNIQSVSQSDTACHLCVINAYATCNSVQHHANSPDHHHHCVTHTCLHSAVMLCSHPGAPLSVALCCDVLCCAVVGCAVHAALACVPLWHAPLRHGTATPGQGHLGCAGVVLLGRGGCVSLAEHSAGGVVGGPRRKCVRVATSLSNVSLTYVCGV
jgi:hypothetical protein